MSTYRTAPEFARPPARHSLTETAEQSRRDTLAWFDANPLVLDERGKVRRVPVAETAAAADELVTQHVPPWRALRNLELLAPFARDATLELEGVAGAPLSFVRAAIAADCRVTVLAAGDAVEVRVDGGRIRAWWKAGRTSGVVMGGRKVTVAEARAAL